MRHMHSRMGHQGVRAIVHALQAEGHRKDCVTRSDIEQFVNERHGACAAHEGMQCAHAPRAIANRSVPQQRFLTEVERCLGVCPACVDYDGANPAPGALGFGCDECLDGYKEPACDNDPPTCAAWYCSRGGPPCYGGSPTPCVCNDGDAAGLAPAPADNDTHSNAPALLDWFAGIDNLIRMPDTWLGTDVIGEVANPGGWFRPPKFFSPGHVCSNGKRGAKLCMCMHEPPRCGAWQCSRSSLASGACTDGAGCACGV